MCKYNKNFHNNNKSYNKILKIFWIIFSIFLLKSCQSDTVFNLDHPVLDQQKIAMTGELKAGEIVRIFVSKTIEDVKSQKTLKEYILKDANVILFENSISDTLKFNKTTLFYESSKTVRPGAKYFVKCEHPSYPEAVSEEVICPFYPKLLNQNVKVLSDTTNICSGGSNDKTHINVQFSITISMDKNDDDQTYFYNYYDQNQDICNLYTGQLIGSDSEDGKIVNKTYHFATIATLKKGSRFKIKIYSRSKEFLYEYKTSDALGAIETGLVSAGPLFSNIKGGLGILKASSSLELEL